MATTTHYDNLRVAHNAPAEVIKASYRVLAQMYHPDRNKDPNAARNMQIINDAYNVLSDPQQRKEHDAWIGKQTGNSGSNGRGSYGENANLRSINAELTRINTLLYNREKEIIRRYRSEMVDQEKRHESAINSLRTTLEAATQSKLKSERQSEFKAWLARCAACMMVGLIFGGNIAASIATSHPK